MLWLCWGCLGQQGCSQYNKKIKTKQKIPNLTKQRDPSLKPSETPKPTVLHPSLLPSIGITLLKDHSKWHGLGCRSGQGPFAARFSTYLPCVEILALSGCCWFQAGRCTRTMLCWSAHTAAGGENQTAVASLRPGSRFKLCRFGPFMLCCVSRASLADLKHPEVSKI